jgi:hypothetical protein
MTGKPRPLTAFLAALAGPIIWFAHFIGLYLAEAFLCIHPRPTVTHHLSAIGAVWTMLALATLLALAVRDRKVADSREGETAAADVQFAFARPLAVLSILAVLWTSGPLLALPACAPAG